jgi:general nucleoside transport system ATP-binding protein
MAAQGAKPARLQLAGISKSFPGVLANDRISFAVQPGEIHALLGENGAGKSTLVKMIYGVLQPDAGDIFWNGQPVTITNPRTARALGIGMVFQHFSLFEAMTVLENIALGMDGSVSTSTLEARVREVLERYGLALDPHRVVSTLSVGERQRIEIVRALLVSTKLAHHGRTNLRPDPAGGGATVCNAPPACGRRLLHPLHFSHKLHEIRDLCDTATILRGGKVVATCDPARETPKSLAEMMIGTNLKQVMRPARAFGADRLIVDGLSLDGEGDLASACAMCALPCVPARYSASPAWQATARTSCYRPLVANAPQPLQAPSCWMAKPVASLPITGRRARGLSAVPEERNGHAAVAEFTLAENTVLTGRAAWALPRTASSTTALPPPTLLASSRRSACGQTVRMHLRLRFPAATCRSS